MVCYVRGFIQLCTCPHESKGWSTLIISTPSRSLDKGNMPDDHVTLFQSIILMVRLVSGSVTHTLRAAVGQVRSEASGGPGFEMQLCLLLATCMDYWIGDQGQPVGRPHYENYCLKHDLV